MRLDRYSPRKRAAASFAVVMLAAGVLAIVVASSPNATNSPTPEYEGAYEPALPSHTPSLYESTDPLNEAPSPVAVLSPEIEALQDQAERDYQHDLALERSADEYDAEQAAKNAR